MTWRSRGYLPHVEGEGAPVMVTYRLADALPAEVLGRWRENLNALEQRKRIQEYLDRGMGACWLREPAIAQLVQDNFHHHQPTAYTLHAWVVMPNHVHVLITQSQNYSLASIVKSWKSYTSTIANRQLGRSGPFWQPEYFDRVIRDERHFLRAVEYIEHNPSKAGLCASPEDWRFSSAHQS